METSKLAGAALAAAAAAMFAAGCAPGTAPFTAAQDPGVVKVKCYGGNACKGQAECKTAMNGCKGQNACKGKGYVMLDERSCFERLGRA